MTEFNEDDLGEYGVVTDKFATEDRRTLVWRGDYRLATFHARIFRPSMFGRGTPVESALAAIQSILSANEILDARVSVSKNGYDDEDELVIKGWVPMDSKWREHRDALVAEAKALAADDEERRKADRYNQYLKLKEEFGDA